MDFAKNGGFESMIDYLRLIENPDTSLDLNIVNVIFHAFDRSSFLFHKDYIKLLAPQLQQYIFKFLNDMSLDQLRNIKKETLESIQNVLKKFLEKVYEYDELNKVIENFNLNLSLRMIKTEFFDKRKQAVSNLVDIIKQSKDNPQKRAGIVKILEENQIFTTIFGKNSHHQIISMSKEILELLLKEKKITDNEIELICSGLKSGGNLEEKLIILKLLSDVSINLSRDHVALILNLIYSSQIQIQDMHKEEIDLIYSLSTHYTQGTETLNKCIKFFISCIQCSKELESEKINHTINKIYEITRQHYKQKNNR